MKTCAYCAFSNLAFSSVVATDKSSFVVYTGKKERCFLAYHVQESYWKHDIMGNKIYMNWHHSWMFPTHFQIRKLVPNYASFYVFFT